MVARNSTIELKSRRDGPAEKTPNRKCEVLFYDFILTSSGENLRFLILDLVPPIDQIDPHYGDDNGKCDFWI